MTICSTVVVTLELFLPESARQVLRGRVYHHCPHFTGEDSEVRPLGHPTGHGSVGTWPQLSPDIEGSVPWAGRVGWGGAREEEGVAISIGVPSHPLHSVSQHLSLSLSLLCPFLCLHDSLPLSPRRAPPEPCPEALVCP